MSRRSKLCHRDSENRNSSIRSVARMEFTMEKISGKHSGLSGNFKRFRIGCCGFDYGQCNTGFKGCSPGNKFLLVGGTIVHMVQHKARKQMDGKPDSVTLTQRLDTHF